MQRAKEKNDFDKKIKPVKALRGVGGEKTVKLPLSSFTPFPYLIHFTPRHLPLEALLGRFELSTPRFVDACSIQLSYRSILGHEGIEPTRVMITADLQSAPPP